MFEFDKDMLDAMSPIGTVDAAQSKISLTDRSATLTGDKGTQRHTAQDFETIEGTKK
jgi:hypothetical protein